VPNISYHNMFLTSSNVCRVIYDSIFINTRNENRGAHSILMELYTLHDHLVLLIFNL